jgi:hypothetical protein
MCLIQLALAVFGGVLMSRRQIRMGNQVAVAPTPFLMGLVLVLQLPLVLMIGFGLGFSEGVDMAKKNQGKQVSQTEMKAQMTKFQQKYWWIDIAFPTAAVAIAGVMLALGLKDQKPEARDPYGDPQADPYADPYAGAERPKDRYEEDDEPALPPKRKGGKNNMFDVIDDDEPAPRRNKRGRDEF